jgi:hypothetical protein
MGRFRFECNGDPKVLNPTSGSPPSLGRVRFTRRNLGRGTLSCPIRDQTIGYRYASRLPREGTRPKPSRNTTRPRQRPRVQTRRRRLRDSPPENGQVAHLGPGVRLRHRQAERGPGRPSNSHQGALGPRAAPRARRREHVAFILSHQGTQRLHRRSSTPPPLRSLWVLAL